MTNESRFDKRVSFRLTSLVSTNESRFDERVSFRQTSLYSRTNESRWKSFIEWLINRDDLKSSSFPETVSDPEYFIILCCFSFCFPLMKTVFMGCLILKDMIISFLKWVFPRKPSFNLRDLMKIITNRNEKSNFATKNVLTCWYWGKFYYRDEIASVGLGSPIFLSWRRKRIVLERELWFIKWFVKVFKKQIMRWISLVNDHDD